MLVLALSSATCHSCSVASSNCWLSLQESTETMHDVTKLSSTRVTWFLRFPIYSLFTSLHESSSSMASEQKLCRSPCYRCLVPAFTGTYSNIFKEFPQRVDLKTACEINAALGRDALRAFQVLFLASSNAPWRRSACNWLSRDTQKTWKLRIFSTSHFWEEHRQRRDVLIKDSNSPSNDFTWHSGMSKPWIPFRSHKLVAICCTDHESPTLMQHQALLGTGHCRNYMLVHHRDRCVPIWQLLATVVKSAVWQYHEYTAIKQPAALMLGVIAGTWCSVSCCHIFSARHNCTQHFHSRFNCLHGILALTNSPLFKRFAEADNGVPRGDLSGVPTSFASWAPIISQTS